MRAAVVAGRAARLLLPWLLPLLPLPWLAAPLLRGLPTLLLCLWRAAGGRSRLEAGDDAALDLAVHHLFDRRHERPVFVAHQRYRLAFSAGAAGAADAVHVVLGDVRQVVVDDV